ncbi:MAG: helix-turn-helix domain-containing protein [Candidatus Gracilibacteria bacterium]|nr:helix-turn-helix domain-containing protein [Candidatus Gracilibacteria bacterium]
MYKITRDDASDMLNISTRSIDRYIRAGKLRSKKQGKIVYINEEDINNFLSGGNRKQEIIVGNIPQTDDVKEISNNIITSNSGNIGLIFEKLKQEIKIKDEEIKGLSVKIGRMEEVVKNSISMIEFKKTQFLLEESKSSLSSDLENIKKQLESKEVLLKEEKKLNYILIIISIIFFIALAIIWLIKI